MTSFVIRGRRVVTPEGIRPAVIHVADGRITRISDFDDLTPSAAAHRAPRTPHLVEARDLIVMPGLVDTHVHVNEPGRTEWEGFATATRAAAAGGVTTLLDMPLNSVPATTSRAALRSKREAAGGKTWVDVGFIGGVVPGNAGELRGLAADGVLAFKCFLVPSGVEEFQDVGEAQPRAAQRSEREASVGKTLIDHGFIGGVVPSSAGELRGLAADRVLGFECFLVPSGVEEFQHVGEAELRKAMPVLASLGVPLMVHAK